MAATPWVVMYGAQRSVSFLFMREGGIPGFVLLSIAGSWRDPSPILTQPGHRPARRGPYLRYDERRTAGLRQVPHRPTDSAEVRAWRVCLEL